MRKAKENILKKNKKVKAVALVILVICVFSLLYIYIVHRDGGVNSAATSIGGNTYGSVNSSAESAAPFTVPPLTQSYTNSVYGFSLSIPSDFTIKEFDTPNAPGTSASHTIVFENAKDDGVQIVIAPYDQKGIKNLTKYMIQSAIPDMKISDDQIVEIGNNYTGLAFKSDNDAFDGDSREVWFIYKDNLYQISTYSRLDDLLKAMFGTWQFAK